MLHYSDFMELQVRGDMKIEPPNLQINYVGNVPPFRTHVVFC